jgi:hypothetical protein
MDPSPSAETRLPRPSDTARRSAPAQKQPLLPVRTATARSSLASKRRKAAASSVAVGPSTALRTSGRSMVTSATGPSISNRTLFIGAFSRGFSGEGAVGSFLASPATEMPHPEARGQSVQCCVGNRGHPRSLRAWNRWLCRSSRSLRAWSRWLCRSGRSLRAWSRWLCRSDRSLRAWSRWLCRSSHLRARHR